MAEHVISGIADQAAEAVEAAIRRAFEEGRAAGRREAAGLMRERLMKAVDLDNIEGLDVGATAAAPASDTKPEKVGRAPAGSVKPVLLKIVQDSGTAGITLADIQDRAKDVNPNSIRGTLHSLREEKQIKRVGDQYFPVRYTNEAAGASHDDVPPAASSKEPFEELLGGSGQPPAQGREAGPGGGG